MPELTFFRQARVDGGIRTGIDVDGTTVLEAFQPGDAEHDPALLWYVDLCASGETLPIEPESVREWLLERTDAIKQILSESSAELKLGFDTELRPYERRSVVASSVPLLVRISAIRRLVSRDIAPHVQYMATNWEGLLQQLAPLASV